MWKEAFLLWSERKRNCLDLFDGNVVAICWQPLEFVALLDLPNILIIPHPPHSFSYFILAMFLKSARRKCSNLQQPLSRLLKLKDMNPILTALLKSSSGEGCTKKMNLKYLLFSISTSLMWLNLGQAWPSSLIPKLSPFYQCHSYGAVFSFSCSFCWDWIVRYLE